MPKQIFSWYPDEGASLAIKPSVESTKFGDGYELRTSFSINTMADKWNVTFTRLPTESKAILAFLKTHGGKVSFQWITPHEETFLFVCRDWKADRMSGGVIRVSGTFEQVFET